MLVAIHQSHYLPWLAYFDKVARADLFVVLDDVQYTKNGWQNRNRIKSPQGWCYLTVPVKERLGQSIADARIPATSDWARTHWRSIQMNYARAPYFVEHREFLQAFYAERWEGLLSMNQVLLNYCAAAMGIGTPIVRSSDLRVGGEATGRLIQICQAVGADAYLTGEYALRAYLDAEQMHAAGIQVVVQRWTPPQYRQQFPRAGFIPNLSILDLLLNEGPRSLEILLHPEVDPRLEATVIPEAA